MIYQSDQRPTVYPDLDSTKDAYVDTAGLLMNVDMVVTPDTSMAHVAGALGVETAVFIREIPRFTPGYRMNGQIS